MEGTKKYIDTIYKERSQFIIIGLTGRTGAGCTTAANVLKTIYFENLELVQPKNHGFTCNDERKYKIIYKYAEKNWDAFQIIKMSDIIFSFILKYDTRGIKDILGLSLNKELVKEIYSSLDSDKEFIESYKTVHEIMLICLNEENSLKRDDNECLKKEYDMLSEISKLQEKFKNHLKNYSSNDKNLYSDLYQKLGNNIRKYGDVLKNDNDSGNNMFFLARRANDFIKAIRYINKLKKVPTLICIDAIRNPYEAIYFKDRYSAFYLMSINTDNEERIKRLNYMNKTQIDSLDELEYPEKLKGTELFFNQNIAACLELSDIHVYNPQVNQNERFFLTSQLVKYFMLMKHPGLITPTHIERCMQIAYNAKLNSGCLSRQVGAVITDSDFSVKAIGWNNVAEGQVSCNLRDIENLYINKDRTTFSDFEIENEKFQEKIEEKIQLQKYKDINGRIYQYCFKDFYEDITKKKNQVHTRALHAEENAFLQIVKSGGQGIKGGNLFTTASPCELCSKKAFQLGIKNIYYIDPYPGISIQHILSFGSNDNIKPKTNLFYGAIGRAYNCLYSQRLSIKDELNLLMDDNS